MLNPSEQPSRLLFDSIAGGEQDLVIGVRRSRLHIDSVTHLRSPRLLTQLVQHHATLLNTSSGVRAGPAWVSGAAKVEQPA